MSTKQLMEAKNIFKELEASRNELIAVRVELLKLPLPSGGKEFIQHLDELIVFIEKTQHEITIKIGVMKKLGSSIYHGDL
jgi:hypothetical protein